MSLPTNAQELTFLGRLSAYRKLVDSALNDLVTSLAGLKLYPQLKYVLLSPGKRLRPILTLLSAECAGGDAKDVLQLALSIELMHNATLVHDDIIDGDEFRRGLPAVHKLWSSDVAILVGDALIALSVKLASAYGEKIVKKAAETALTLCEGELIDITAELDTYSEQVYLDRVKRKSASLFKLAAEVGALAVDAPEHVATALSSFAENYGIAYQIKDDLEDLDSAPLANASFSKGILPLPILLLYSRGDGRIRSLIQEMVHRKNNPSDDIVRLVRAAKELKVDAYCKFKAREYLRRAAESLSAIRALPKVEYFEQMLGVVGLEI